MDSSVRSNWARATDTQPEECARCGEERLIERDGETRVCLVCAHDWRVVNGKVVARR